MYTIKVKLIFLHFRYIVHKRTLELKKIEKLKASLHLLDAQDKPANTHTFFVDSDREKREFDVAKKLDTHPALLDRTYNRLRLSDLVCSHVAKGLKGGC